MHPRLTHSTGIPQQNRHASRHSTWYGALAVAVLLLFLISYSAQAKTFHCGAGDALCLIAAMTEANANGKKRNVIRLDVGIYVVPATANHRGLPVTSTLTLTGAGADLTILEGMPPSRMLSVEPTGTLTIDGITMTGGYTAAEGGGKRLQ
jgi:hypothetical protein